MLPIKGASLLVCLSVYLFFLLPDYGFLRRAAMGCGWRYFSSRLCSSRIHCLWKTILQGQSWHGKRNVQVSNTYRLAKKVCIHSWSKIDLFGLDPNSLLFVSKPNKAQNFLFKNKGQANLDHDIDFGSNTSFILYQHVHFYIEISIFGLETFVSQCWLLNQIPTLGSKIHFCMKIWI